MPWKNETNEPQLICRLAGDSLWQVNTERAAAYFFLIYKHARDT